MREVLAARSDRDFVSAGPRGRSRSPVTSGARRLVAAALRRPGLLVGGLVIATATTAIVVNALSFQSARHPAPIFAKAERAPERVASARPLEAAAPVLPPAPPARPLPTPPTVAVPQPAARPSRDAIADLIRGAETTGSAAPARSADGRAEPQRHVASAQRALLKLGYGPLKTDGIFGQGTRQAIERFERDRKLTPTGELGTRTVRELSAQSGILVE